MVSFLIPSTRGTWSRLQKDLWTPPKDFMKDLAPATMIAGRYVKALQFLSCCGLEQILGSCGTQPTTSTKMKKLVARTAALNQYIGS